MGELNFRYGSWMLWCIILEINFFCSLNLIILLVIYDELLQHDMVFNSLFVLISMKLSLSLSLPLSLSLLIKKLRTENFLTRIWRFLYKNLSLTRASSMSQLFPGRTQVPCKEQESENCIQCPLVSSPCDLASTSNQQSPVEYLNILGTSIRKVVLVTLKNVS